MSINRSFDVRKTAQSQSRACSDCIKDFTSGSGQGSFTRHNISSA